jgi:hypothetical protein
MVANEVIGVDVQVRTKDAKQGFDRIVESTKKFASGMSQTSRTVEKFGFTVDNAGNVMKTLKSRVTDTGDRIGSLTSRIKDSTSQFQGWALSIMFFGMAIERVFLDIMKKSFRVFNDVMASTQDGISNISLLSAHLQFLGFTIGAAVNQFLEPFLPVIINIIKNIAEWVERNPGLTASILLIGLAVGILLKIIGMLVLAIQNGIIPMFMKFAGLVKGIGAVFAGTAISTIILWAAIVIAIIAAVIVAWKTNFAGFKDFVVNTFGIIFAVFGSIWGNLVKVFKGIMDLLVAIWEGRWEDVGKILFNIVKNIFAIVAKLAIGINMIFQNMARFIANIFIEAVNFIVRQINFLIRRFNRIRGFLNKVPGINLPNLAEIGQLGKVGFLGKDDFNNEISRLNNFIGLTENKSTAPAGPVIENVNVNIEQPTDVDTLFDELKKYGVDIGGLV